jgi:hypothetical protein
MPALRCPCFYFSLKYDLSGVHKDVTEGSVTISLHNFVGEGIIKCSRDRMVVGFVTTCAL